MSAVAEDSFIESLFLPFIETVPDAMVLSNAEGKIVLINTNTEKLFGYRRDEVAGEKVEVLIPARFHARHCRHRANYYSDPHIIPMGIGRELSACRKDGSEFRVEVNLGPVQIKGELFVWSAIRDVSLREALLDRMLTALQERGSQRGIVSICAWCKRVRDERGSWQTLEQYVASHSDINFPHDLCKDCLQKLDPNSR